MLTFTQLLVAGDLLSLIKSIPYTIGYVSNADIIGDKQNIGNQPLKKALIRNKMGKYVSSENTAVQAAMDDRSDAMSHRLTARLVNAGGKETYPLSTYTYFIVFMNYTRNCSEVTELFMFFEAYYTEKTYADTISKYRMVPLSERIRSRVRNIFAIFTK